MQQRVELSVTFANIANQLLNSAGTGTASVPVVPPTIDNSTERMDEMPVEEQAVETGTDPATCPPIMLDPKYYSLRQLYEQWYGEGDFDDGIGGIAGRDKRYGPKWRKGIIAPKQFSRMKMIMQGIRSIREAEMDLDDRDAVRDLEPKFKELKYSITNMAKYLQEAGHVKKQSPRGKSKRPSP